MMTGNAINPHQQVRHASVKDAECRPAGLIEINLRNLGGAVQELTAVLDSLSGALAPILVDAGPACEKPQSPPPSSPMAGTIESICTQVCSAIATARSIRDRIDL